MELDLLCYAMSYSQQANLSNNNTQLLKIIGISHMFRSVTIADMDIGNVNKAKIFCVLCQSREMQLVYSYTELLTKQVIVPF